jgi:hypothetical protein
MIVHPLSVLVLIPSVFFIRSKVHISKWLLTVLLFFLLVSGLIFFKMLFMYFKVVQSTIQEQELSSGFWTLTNTLKSNFFQVCLLLLGIAGLVMMWLKSKELFRLFAAMLLFYGLIGFFGSHVGILPYIKPGRLVLSYIVILAICTAYLADQIWSNNSKATAVFCLCVTVFLLFILFTILPNYWHMSYYFFQEKLTTDIPKETIELLEFFKNNTEKSGRILLEDSCNENNCPRHVYGGHITAMFPLFVDRMYFTRDFIHQRGICSPEIINGRLEGTSLDAIDDKQLMNYFNTFNIKWIVVWSAVSKARLDKMNTSYLTKVFSNNKFEIFLTGINASYFMFGKGSIKVEDYWFEINNPGNKSIVLKFFYVEGLRTEPRVKIENYPLKDYDCSFIHFEKKSSSFPSSIKSTVD